MQYLTRAQEELSPEDKEEVKRIRKQMEQKSEEQQDADRNITKHKLKLERLEKELAEVKCKLEFNEEYALVLTYGSQIAAIKMSNQKEGMAVSGRDRTVYERRLVLYYA